MHHPTLPSSWYVDLTICKILRKLRNSLLCNHPSSLGQEEDTSTVQRWRCTRDDNDQGRWGQQYSQSVTGIGGSTVSTPDYVDHHPPYATGPLDIQGNGGTMGVP